MSLTGAVSAAVGATVASERRVGGGDINEGWAMELSDGRRLFVKTRADAPAGEYTAEAAGLAWLAAPGALAVAEVVAVGDLVGGDEPRFLALEWIDEGQLHHGGDEELGRGLARVHAAGASAFGAGPPQACDAPVRFGSLELSNEPLDTWPAFYAQRRLAPLLPRAGLSPSGRAALERVIERVDELAGPAEPPARLHGDLWSGNVLAGADGRPRLIDPAAHGGHREVDLAMLALFGAPSTRTMAAYEDVHPLADGHEDRTGLWQLFPLLVHAALLGGGYAARAEAVATQIG